LPGPVPPQPAYPAALNPQLPPYQVIATLPPMAPAPAPVSRGRGATIAAGIAAAAAVLAAIVVVVVTLLDRPAAPPADRNAGPNSGQSAGPSTGPNEGGSKPTQLTLRDDGTAITITWVDPSGGAVSFIVAGAGRGQQLGPMGTVGPGKTSHTINGLDAHIDYCFTVVAVYSTDVVATSEQVCTNRGSTPR
jgi:hypothetical protein